MDYSFSIAELRARLPACQTDEDLALWARGGKKLDREGTFAKAKNIPMMKARRMDAGCRLSVDLGLEMFSRHPDTGAVVYSSRHGELVRNYNILHALATGTDVSPTDFTMSVHNAAVGSFTISSGAQIPSTSVSAGHDSFCQGLFEVLALFAQGIGKVLMVYFDTRLPEAYLPYLPEDVAGCAYAHAIAMVLTPGDGFTFTIEENGGRGAGEMPQELAFLKSYLLSEASFRVGGQRLDWVFKRQS